MTSDGRTMRPSGRWHAMPRTRPVIPATRTIIPLAGLPSIVGSMISFAVHPIRVRTPLNVCPEQRFAMPSNFLIG